jgi:hypothetical protein
MINAKTVHAIARIVLLIGLAWTHSETTVQAQTCSEYDCPWEGSCLGEGDCVTYSGFQLQCVCKQNGDCVMCPFCPSNPAVCLQ